jgi:hypothetical protein
VKVALCTLSYIQDLGTYVARFTLNYTKVFDENKVIELVDTKKKDSFIKDEDSIIDKKTFKTVVTKLKQILEQELRGKIESLDFDSLLISLENINRRSYRSKAKKLLQSLGILDTETKEAHVDVISVSNKITQAGRFSIGAGDIYHYYKKFMWLSKQIK